MTEEKTCVRKLIKSVEAILNTYSDNLITIAAGEIPAHPIDDKTIDTVIKIVKEMTNFEQFEKISNPDIKSMSKAIAQRKPVENIYEHVVNEVKNGNAKVRNL